MHESNVHTLDMTNVAPENTTNNNNNNNNKFGKITFTVITETSLSVHTENRKLW